MEEQTHVGMVVTGYRLSLGPDGETGFVKQGGKTRQVGREDRP